MSKRILTFAALVFSVTLVFSGCQQKDEKGRLSDLTVEMACNFIKPLREGTDRGDISTPEGLAKLKEQTENLQKQMEALPKKYGFADEKTLKDAMSKYENDKQFEQDVLKAVKDKCGFDLGSLGAL